MQYALQTQHTSARFLKSIKNAKQIIWTADPQEALLFPDPKDALAWYQQQYDAFTQKTLEQKAKAKATKTTLKGSLDAKGHFTPNNNVLFQKFISHIEEKVTWSGAYARSHTGFVFSDKKINALIDKDSVLTGTQKTAIKKLKDRSTKIARLLSWGAGIPIQMPSTHFKVSLPAPEKFTTKSVADKHDLVDDSIGIWVIKTPQGYKTATTYGNPKDIANAKMYTDEHKALKDAEKLSDAFLVKLKVSIQDLLAVKPIKSAALTQTYSAFNALIERHKLEAAIYEQSQKEQKNKAASDSQHSHTPTPPEPARKVARI